MTTYEKISLVLDLILLGMLVWWLFASARHRRYHVIEAEPIKRDPQLIVIRSNNISYDKFEFVTDNIEDYEHSDTIEFYLERRLVARFLRDDIVSYYEKGHINMCNNILEGKPNASKA